MVELLYSGFELLVDRLGPDLGHHVVGGVFPGVVQGEVVRAGHCVRLCLKL